MDLLEGKALALQDASVADAASLKWTAMRPLPPALLRRCCEASALAFKTTDDLTGACRPRRPGARDRRGPLRHAMRRHGFNIFAFGPSGTGKHTLVQEILEAPGGIGGDAARLVLRQ